MVTNLNPKRIEFPITGPLLLPPMAAPVTAIVDDQDPRIVWTGTWHPFVDPSFGQYNRSFHSTGKDDTDAGPSRAAFSFNGERCLYALSALVTNGSGLQEPRYLCTPPSKWTPT